MQRYAVVFLVFITGLISGCGSSNKSKTPTAATITVSPSTVSLDAGRFLALTATILDANGGTVVSLTPTWSSSNSNIVDVSTNGAVCAGKWNSTTAPTICTPGPAGSAVITAAAGGISGSVTVYSHSHIARLELTVPAGCTSQGQTQALAAKALDPSNADITATVGPIAFTLADSSIATVDANGVVTAKRPGSTLVTASISGTNAVPAAFVTCPPAAIEIGQQGSPAVTDFSLAATQTATLAAAVRDTKGNPITDIVLTYSSSAPGVATATTSALTGTVTANNAGRATVIASCTPPGCNTGSNRAVYSNVATVTVTGASSPRVVAASTTSNSVVVIDSTNAVVATVAVPSVTVNGAAKTPVLNSVVMSGDGTKAFFGSDVAVLQFDLGTNTFLATSFLSGGRVIAASSDGGKVATTDGTILTVIDVAAVSGRTYPIVNANSGDFSQDAFKLFATAGGTLRTVNRATNVVNSLALNAAATDVKFLPQGSLAIVAEPGANAQIFATCDDSSLGAVAAQPQLLASSSDSARMFGANTTTVFSITPTVEPPATPTTNATDCAPKTVSGTLPTSVASAALGQTISPRQLIAAPNHGSAIVLGDTTSIFRYTDGGSVTAIPLNNGGTSTTGGITPDSATLYVGTTNGDVQKIDLASGVVLQSIPAGLKKADGSGTFPDLVAVRPK